MDTPVPAPQDGWERIARIKTSVYHLRVKMVDLVPILSDHSIAHVAQNGPVQHVKKMLMNAKMVPICVKMVENALTYEVVITVRARRDGQGLLAQMILMNAER